MFWWQRIAGILDAELIFILRHAWKRGTAIDVGANRGMYTYGLARRFDRVEAFEPNDAVIGPLRAVRSVRIRVHVEALSDREGDAVLHSPVSAEGVEYAGWGSLHANVLPDSPIILTRRIRTKTLDAYAYSGVVFIKIDIESHEVAALNGAAATIARCRPTLLIEIKPGCRRDVWEFFSGRQYECYFLAQNKLVRLSDPAAFACSSAENFFWVPSESFASIIDLSH